jgi:hypothetical protein
MRNHTLNRAADLRRTGADNQRMIARYLKARHADLKPDDVASNGYQGLWCKKCGAVGAGVLKKVKDATCECVKGSAPSKSIRQAAVHFTVLDKAGNTVAKGCSATPRYSAQSTDKQPLTMNPQHVGCGNCRNRIQAAMRLND